MKVSALIELLQRQNADSTVVVCDKTDFVRAGLIRPLSPAEVQPVQLGEVLEDDGRWVCEWRERPVDCEGPMLGLLLGPR